MDPIHQKIHRSFRWAVCRSLHYTRGSQADAAGTARDDDEFWLRCCLQERQRCLEQDERAYSVDVEMLLYLFNWCFSGKAEIVCDSGIGDHDVEFVDAVYGGYMLNGRFRVCGGGAVDLDSDDSAAVGSRYGGEGFGDCAGVADAGYDRGVGTGEEDAQEAFANS